MDSLSSVGLMIVTWYLVKDLTTYFGSRCWWQILAATLWCGGFFSIGRIFWGGGFLLKWVADFWGGGFFGGVPDLFTLGGGFF